MEVDVKRVNINLLENLQVQYDNAQVCWLQQLNIAEICDGLSGRERYNAGTGECWNYCSDWIDRLVRKSVWASVTSIEERLDETAEKMISWIHYYLLTEQLDVTAYTDKLHRGFIPGPRYWYRSYGLTWHCVCYFDGLDKGIKFAVMIWRIFVWRKRIQRKNLETQYINATNDLMNNQRNFKNKRIIIFWQRMSMR